MIRDRQHFHKRLKLARQEARLKQEQVARYLQIPISAVSALEAGNRKLDAIELYMLSKLYHKSLDWFFSDYSPMQEPGDSSGTSSMSYHWDDPVLHECFQLLQKAPKDLQRSAAYGVIGFLSER